MTARDEWQHALDSSPTRDGLDPRTMSGVPIDAAYGPDDGEFPGQYPYTRGVLRLDVPVAAVDHAHVRRVRYR